MVEIFADCAQVMVPAASEQTMRYYTSGNWLWAFETVWSFVVPFLFLVTGLAGKLEDFSRKVGRNWFFTIAVFVTLYLLITQLLSLPLDYYTGFVREHAFSLSNQTLARWVQNYGKGILLAIVGGVAFIWIFYLILKKSPTKWWIWGSAASIVISFFLMVIQPIWIDPLFNQFGPMKNKELEGQILALAGRAGIQDGKVFEVDMRQDTKTLNAYVIGFGATKRIVLWDTTIARLKPNEVLFVMGHEMGHYVLHHMWWGFGFLSVLAVVIFYLMYRIGNFLVKKYRWGFRRLDQIASLPLFVLMINVLLFLTAPISNFFSRYLEHEADRFGLEITQDNQAAGEAFVVLQQEDLVNPRPGLLFKIFRSSHPPMGERVDFTNRYCPWSEGKPLKYGNYFQD